MEVGVCTSIWIITKRKISETSTTKGIVIGYENAIEDLDSAVFNYIDELDLPSETMKEILSQSVRHFAEYAKGYLSDRKDMFIVASIDGQLE